MLCFDGDDMLDQDTWGLNDLSANVAFWNKWQYFANCELQYSVFLKTIDNKKTGKSLLS